MKLCRYNDQKLGLVVGEQLIDVTEAIAAAGEWRWPLPPGDRLIAALDAVCAEVETRRKWGFVQLHESASMLSPVANPTKVIGAPANYRAHIDEANADPGITFGTETSAIDRYGLFLKNPVPVGPSEGVALRYTDRRNDHELELAMIVGRVTRDVAEADALDHVAGYAIGLDMTVRGREDRSLCKAIDSYSVLGPWMVTADEIEDPDALALRLWVNGDLRQDSTTANQIFDCRKLIAYASRHYTLYPGDVIMTGTPEGVGPVQPGDVMRCEIEGIGAMEVAVRAAG